MKRRTAFLERVVYNEIEPYPAQWLRNLSNAGHIAEGLVDERSIQVLPVERVRDAAQFHAFAGIGAWSHALRLAGWPDDRPVWTGSCPCQPFSQAGRGAGFDDERHLWPDWFRLIRAARPPVIFGEQVASKDGLAWFDLVSSDLEGEGYTVGAADLCAASVGAPHIRQRLYFVAVAEEVRRGAGWAGESRVHGAQEPRGPREVVRLADDGRAGLARRTSLPGDDGREREAAERGGGAQPRRVGLSNAGGREERPVHLRTGGPREEVPDVVRSGSFWHPVEWLECRDGKHRPVEPGTFPLAHGAPARVGRLRGYGNSIVAPLAATFIEACMDVL